MTSQLPLDQSRPGRALVAAQRDALALLAGIIGKTYYLAGGVSIALRYGHRISEDLDLFTELEDPQILVAQLEAKAEVRITSRADHTVYAEVCGVPVSLLRFKYPLLQAVHAHPEVPVALASISDLIAMKLSAIAGRGAARDFWDLHTMLRADSLALADALTLFQRKFAQHDIGYVVRALGYFADAPPLPRDLQTSHWQLIQADFERWVVELSNSTWKPT